MPSYSQAGRPLQITTPLGTDQLLLVGFRGQESISRLFRFELEMLADVNTDIKFENIIGQSVTVQMLLPNEDTRYFNGIVSRFIQGASDDLFTVYRAEVVPEPWLLTKTVQSRIFQNMSVPDILNEVLADFDFTLELSATYYARNYCVQYRESDFDFASRLMEDEGIYYYFNHTDGAHQMIVTDAPTSYPEVPGQSNFLYEPRHGGVGEDMRIRTWEKAQELRSAQYTVADYSFEMPTGNLLESNPILDQVQVGTVTHQLNLAGTQAEIYDYPGGYAKRYDAVSSQGNSFAQGFTQIFNDRSRIVGVRMEEEECQSLEITGTSDCGNLSAGYIFTLEGHFNGDGDYLLTRVEHHATLSGYRPAEQEAFSYDSRFACMPTGLTYRPRRVTSKPVIAGPQTATVTGPTGDTSSGQSVYCDEYGRVKVQFHWDRQGQMDSNSSCWLRVGQIWAGSGWGAFFWPRTTHEVVVAFEDGDPDKPLIVGSVYNASNMPPYALPANSALGGVRSASISGTSGKNFNGIVFNDTNGTEHLAIHSENNMSLNSEGDKQFHGGGNKGERVSGSAVFTVGGWNPLGSGSGGGPGSTSASGGGTGGGPPAGSVSPTSLSFGNQNVGSTSGTQTVTFTNNGSSNLSITSFALSDSTDFAQTNDYDGTLPPGGTCTITVTFTPSAVGALTGTLTLTDSANNQYTVSLSGTGIQGGSNVSLSPSSLTFSDQDVNTESDAQTVTLTNTGNATLSNFTVTVTPGTGFAQTNTCGSSVAAGSSCTINVTYNPTSAGSSSDTLTVTDSAGNQYTVSLSGNGIAAPSGPWSNGNTMIYNPSQQYGGQYAQAVYGEELSMVVGTNYSLYLGGNTTLFIDPLAVLNFFPGMAGGAAGLIFGSILSATGGNNSFTIGDNTSFSWGQQSTITLTPEDQGANALNFTAQMSQCVVIDVLVVALMILAGLWAMFYSAYQQVQQDSSGNSVANSQDDQPITTLVGTCQGVATALQTAIVIAGGVYSAAQQVQVLAADGQVLSVPAPAAEATAADADATTAAKDVPAAQKESDDAESEAKTAKTTADDAKTKADDAKTKADDAKTKADDAKTKADDAKTKADDAKTKADDAKTKADDAKTKADDAKTKADDAKTKADDAKTEADKADAEAKVKEQKAKETKDPKDVEDAKAARERANTKADDAKTKAEAKTKADEAKTKADDAKTKADDAKTKADEAKTKADDAKTKADDAKTKADDAKTKADDDKTKADEAKTKADDAKTKADAKAAEAKTKLKTAQDKAKALRAKADRLQAKVKAKKLDTDVRKKIADKTGMGKGLVKQL